MNNEEKAKYQTYRDVYAFLHYDYEYENKSKTQIIEDIKLYCFKKAEEILQTKEEQK